MCMHTGSCTHRLWHKGSMVAYHTHCPCFHLIIVKWFRIFHRPACFLNRQAILLWQTQVHEHTYTNSKNRIFWNGILIRKWQLQFKNKWKLIKILFLIVKTQMLQLKRIKPIFNSDCKCEQFGCQLIYWFLHLTNLWRYFPYGYILFECFLK